MNDIKVHAGTKCAYALLDLIDYLSNANEFDLSKLSVAGLDVTRMKIQDLISVLKEIEVKEN